MSSLRLSVSAQLSEALGQLQDAKKRIDELAIANTELARTGFTNSNRIRDLEAANAELLTKLEAVTKESNSHKSMRDHYERSASKSESELEQSHLILDAIEGAPAREYDTSYGGKAARALTTRLAGAFISIAAKR